MEDEHKYYVKDYSERTIGDEIDLKNLRDISDRSISELCSDWENKKKSPKLLIFPNELNAYKDDIYKYEICEISDNTLKSNDILGFVGIGNTELTIYSRFTEQRGDGGNTIGDKEDFFLHYMVQKVFNINLFDLKHSTSQDRVFDFLLCLFPKYLKDALRQGLYKQYVVNKYNDSNVRGMIDVARHIKRNIPFAGKIAYNVREYSYDNNITQLIRHTIEYIRSSNMFKVLKQDDDTVKYVSQICEATPTYKYQDRSKIISKNLKAPTSPYYFGYIPLQKLCVQILTHKKLKYGNDDNDRQIYGLLFVGSWLWEEYLSMIMKDCGFTHAKNKTGDNAIYLFIGKHYERFPDYYRHKGDRYNSDFVLDAKYKHLDENKIDRNDMHQVISYMYVLNAKKGGFIFPYAVDKKGCEIDEQYLGKLNGHEGKGGKLFVIGVPIFTRATGYDEFQDEMIRIEGDLKRKITEISNRVDENSPHSTKQ